MRRQQATANSRCFRSLTLPHRNSIIIGQVGSLHDSHSALGHLPASEPPPTTGTRIGCRDNPTLSPA